MDLRGVLRPVGHEQAYVYWIRRLVVVVVLLLLVVGVAHACGGSPGSTGRAGSGRPTSLTPTPTPTPTSTPTSAVAAGHRASGPRCRRGQLTVTASADAQTYPAGAEPRLTAVVRNGGPSCRYDPAPAVRTWRVLSGSDVVWTTTDCHRSAAATPIRLGRGHSVSYALVWDRHRSTPGCASPGAAAQPGTYRLYVSVMGAVSAPAVFHLAG